jgi:PAS domain S-box-containing protein
LEKHRKDRESRMHMMTEYLTNHHKYAKDIECAKLLEFVEEGCLDGIWDLDLAEYEHKGVEAYEYLSPKFKAILGYAEDELENKVSTWLKLIFPEDTQEALGMLDTHIETGAEYKMIARYKHRDGRTISVVCRGMVIRDDNGKPVRMIGAHTDITALQNAKEKIVELETDKQDTFETLKALTASIQNSKGTF